MLDLQDNDMISRNRKLVNGLEFVHINVIEYKNSHIKSAMLKNLTDYTSTVSSSTRWLRNFLIIQNSLRYDLSCYMTLNRKDRSRVQKWKITSKFYVKDGKNC